MKKIFILLAALFCLGAHAQNGVEVFSGFIADTLTTAQLDALPSRVKRKGAHFYNNEISSLVSWNGTEWVPVGGDSAPILITEENYLLLDPEDRPTNADIIGEAEEGSSGGIQSVVAGTNISIDNTDPENPVISASNVVTDNTNQTVAGEKTYSNTARFSSFLIPKGGVEINATNPALNLISWFPSNQVPSGAANGGAAGSFLLNANDNWTFLSTGSGGKGYTFINDGLTVLRNLTIPNKDGTLAMLDDIPTSFNTEQIQDLVGAMWSSNTENGATVTYQDGDGTVDIAVNANTANIVDGAITESKLNSSFYEEDSFTPTVIDGTEGGGSGTYTISGVADGDFTRVGNQVTVSITISNINTSGSPSDDLHVTGLPYSSSGMNGQFTVTITGSSVSFYSITGILASNAGPTAAGIAFKIQDSLDGDNFGTNLSSVTLTSSTIRINGTYIANPVP